MVRRFVGSMLVLAVLAALTPLAARAQEVVSGTVKQIDERSGVIVFDDGRRVQTTSRTVVLLDQRVDRLAAVRPGSSIVVVQPDAAAVVTPSASPSSLSPIRGNIPQAP